MRIQGDDALRSITEVLLSLPQGHDNLAAHARHTLVALHLRPVVDAQSGGHRLVIASSRSPGQARMDLIGQNVLNYGWKLLAGGKLSLRVVRWSRLLEYLLGKLDRPPVFIPPPPWDHTKPTLRRSATACALAGVLLRQGVLLRHHEA